ncbi:hypothetical protein [Saccharothrix sp. HUAS TT1]|uniref:hypothetical protein n=1 Tax=unclassified Saccharothrix TaxID=2593673 RepID=UPI00345B52CA
MLGAVAHRGGSLVQRPELTIGVKQAISRSTGLDLDLVTRQPLDRRDATRRQHDTRVAEPVAPAPRRLLPAFDEGVDLRVGTLDDEGRAHWHFPTSWSSGSGDHFEGRSGPVHDFAFRLPPAFDEITLVLAWPEIGFPETTVTLPLPDRATADRATRSVWDAPVSAVATAERFEHHVAASCPEVDVETGTSAAAPQVLHRSDHAAIVLTRLTVVDRTTLSVGLASSARGDAAQAIRADTSRGTDSAPAIAVVADGKAFWVRSHSGSASGGAHGHSGSQDFLLPRPHDDVLDLLVAWPRAGLGEARARIPLDSP